MTLEEVRNMSTSEICEYVKVIMDGIGQFDDDLSEDLLCKLGAISFATRLAVADNEPSIVRVLVNLAYEIGYRQCQKDKECV